MYFCSADSPRGQHWLNSSAGTTDTSSAVRADSSSRKEGRIASSCPAYSQKYALHQSGRGRARSSGNGIDARSPFRLLRYGFWRNSLWLGTLRRISNMEAHGIYAAQQHKNLLPPPYSGIKHLTPGTRPPLHILPARPTQRIPAAGALHGGGRGKQAQLKPVNAKGGGSSRQRRLRSSHATEKDCSKMNIKLGRIIADTPCGRQGPAASPCRPPNAPALLRDARTPQQHLQKQRFAVHRNKCTLWTAQRIGIQVDQRPTLARRVDPEAEIGQRSSQFGLMAAGAPQQRGLRPARAAANRPPNVVSKNTRLQAVFWQSSLANLITFLRPFADDHSLCSHGANCGALRYRISSALLCATLGSPSGKNGAVYICSGASSESRSAHREVRY